MTRWIGITVTSITSLADIRLTDGLWWPPITGLYITVLLFITILLYYCRITPLADIRLTDCVLWPPISGLSRCRVSDGPWHSLCLLYPYCDYTRVWDYRWESFSRPKKRRNVYITTYCDLWSQTLFWLPQLFLATCWKNIF